MHLCFVYLTVSDVVKTGEAVISNLGSPAIGVSGAGGFHPCALQDPYVTVSRHTAPTVQPMAESQIPKTQVAWVHGVQCDPTSGSP